MELFVLIIHLVVCACLIGLVLLQRSEGGALGMGGGGGGALMSGRGAADALAKMTSVAGGFFLVTSLGLTVLSGAQASSDGRSVLDNIIPQSSAPVAPAPEPAPPTDQRPDPTEGAVEPSTQLASLTPGPTDAAAAPPTAPAPTVAAARAGPLPPANTTNTGAPQQRATPPRATPVSTSAPPPPRQPAANTSTQRTTTTANTTQRPAGTQPTQRTGAATTPASTPPRPLVLPNTSGAATGAALDNGQTQPESVEAGSGVEAVRRQTRAGPDQ